MLLHRLPETDSELSPWQDHNWRAAGALLVHPLLPISQTWSNYTQTKPPNSHRQGRLDSSVCVCRYELSVCSVREVGAAGGFNARASAQVETQSVGAAVAGEMGKEECENPTSWDRRRRRRRFIHKSKIEMPQGTTYSPSRWTSAPMTHAGGTEQHRHDDVISKASTHTHTRAVHFAIAQTVPHLFVFFNKMSFNCWYLLCQNRTGFGYWTRFT